jgi:integrase
LRPTLEHTVYSLRHTFKDRLIALECPEWVQDALMGHRVREVEYGAGPSLEQKARWLERVWG